MQGNLYVVDYDFNKDMLLEHMLVWGTVESA